MSAAIHDPSLQTTQFPSLCCRKTLSFIQRGIVTFVDQTQCLGGPLFSVAHIVLVRVKPVTIHGSDVHVCVAILDPKRD